MIRRLIVRAEAEADIIEAALWYEAEKKGLGLGLALEIRAAFPVSRPVHPSAGCHRCFLRPPRRTP